MRIIYLFFLVMADLLADLLADSDSDDHLDDNAGAATAAAAAAVGSMGAAAAAAAPAGGAGEMPAHPLGGGGALHAAPAPAPVPDAAESDTTWPAPPELPPEKPTKARRRWVPPEFDLEVGAGVEEEEADENRTIPKKKPRVASKDTTKAKSQKQTKKRQQGDGTALPTLSEVDHMKLPDIRAALKELGIPSSGLKVDVSRRLKEAITARRDDGAAKAHDDDDDEKDDATVKKYAQKRVANTASPSPATAAFLSPTPATRDATAKQPPAQRVTTTTTAAGRTGTAAPQKKPALLEELLTAASDDDDMSPSPATAAFVSPTPATRDLPTPPSRPTPSISQRPSQYNSDPAVADKPKTVSRPRTSRGRQTIITNLTPKTKRNRHLARSSRRSADIKIACKILYQRYVTQTTSPMNDAKWGR